MSDSEQSGAGQREVAYRIFAAEFDDADYSFSESDEERAPNYVVTPTGARANRLFVVGVLTEIEEVSEDVLRARVVDPTGAFVLYAGQYQPDEQAFLEGVEPPTFVAVTGKARTFSPDDSDQVFTSIRPESISEVDAETRDRWTVQAAEQTIDRVRWAATALTLEEPVRDALLARGADEGLAHGIELALSHYGTTAEYLDSVYEMAVDAARVVAGERGEIDGHTKAPAASGPTTAADLLAKLPDGPVGAASGIEADTGDDSTEARAVDQPASGTAGSEPADTSSGETTAEASEATETPASTEPRGESSEAGSEGAPQEGSASADADPVTGEQGDSDLEEESPEIEPEASEPEASEPEASEPEESGGESAPDELGDFEPDEEFELEAETREEIESEYGTEFKSGTEVEEPGNADIETPDPADVEEQAGEAADSTAGGEQPGTAQGGAVEDEAGSAGEDGAEDVAEDESADAADDEADEATEDEADGDSLADPDDVQEAVVDLMAELDDGDGADREQLVSEMESRHGVDQETTEDAIQSALMDGRCYEPNDTSLKPI